MDESTIHQELQAVSEVSRHQNFKKALKVLLSVSIFSFLISYSSWLHLFLHSFNIYFSAYPFNLFNYSIDRSYMFLLFNGILAFLASNSGLISSSPFGIDVQEESIEKRAYPLQSQNGFSEMNHAVENAVVEEENKVENEILVTEGEAEEKDQKEEEEEEEEEELNWALMTFEEEEEEEEEEGSLSTEELNKKCDDFIKRMKEEIMFESQRGDRDLMIIWEDRV